MGHSTHVLRALALIVVAVFVAAACSKKNNNNSTAPQTEPPTASPAVQSAGNFGLVGGVDHAFEGVGPPVQVALAGVSLTPGPDASGPSGTTATNGATPSRQGVMRVTLDTVSAPLHDKCGVSAGDKVNVFWLTDTQFDAALLTGSSLESSLEGHKVGVAGSIFVTGSSDQSNANLGLPTPSASPSTTAGTLNTNCTLVADSISSTATEVPPTVRPRSRATSTPKATVKPTATPKPTPTPTPKHTATPTPTHTATPTPTI